MVLKILMLIGNVKLIDGYIAKGKLSKLKGKKLRDFTVWYLNQKYNPKTEYKEMVFSIVDKARKVFSLEELEEMVIDSRFLATKPNADIPYFFIFDNDLKRRGNLLNLDGMPLLQTYLTSRIDSNRKLIDLINTRSALDYDYAFRKLASADNINVMLEYDRLLNKDIRYYHFMLAKRMVLSNLYSFADIKKYFLETNNDAETIVNCFISLFEAKEQPSEKEQVINSFTAIIDEIQNRIESGEETDLLTGEYLPGYEECAFAIFKSSVSLDMINELVKKLLQDKKYYFINELFLNGIESDYDYDVLDALMLEDKNIIKDTLSSISDKYLEYALTKLLDRDRSFINDVIEFICDDYNNLYMLYDAERIDRTLEFIYFRYYDFKISKESAISLIKIGSKHIPKFMGEYDFTEDERKDIYESYKWKDSDFERVYGLYLVNGDRKYLLSEKDAKEEFAKLKARRKKVRERRK